MAIAHVKIGVVGSNYLGIAALTANVIAGLTANPGNFPAPFPTIVTLTVDLLALNNAITAWGIVGNRGSHADWVALEAAALTMRNDLLLEADYVNNLVDPTQPYAVQAAFIATSGFSVKNLPMPQGVLGMPLNLHRQMSDAISENDIMLRWNKPIGLTSPNNVKSYRITMLPTGVPPVSIFNSTKTSILITSAELAAGNVFHGINPWFKIEAYNNDGFGTPTAYLVIHF